MYIHNLVGLLIHNIKLIGNYPSCTVSFNGSQCPSPGSEQLYSGRSPRKNNSDFPYYYYIQKVAIKKRNGAMH